MTFLLRCALLLSWLMCSTVSWAAPIVLEQDRIVLNRQVEVFVDTTRSLQVHEIAAAGMDGQFWFFSERAPDFSAGDVWLKITLKQPHNKVQEWWLEVQPSTLEYLTLYQQRPDGTIISSYAGKNMPFDSRPVPYRNSTFKVLLEDAQPHVVYLKIATYYQVLNRAILWQPSAFLAEAEITALMWGGYLGIFLLLSIVSIWFERAVGDGVYRAFGIYTFSCVLMTLGATGYFNQYILPADLSLETLPFVTWTLLFGLVASISFFFRFIGMHALKPRLTYYYLNGLRVYMIVMGIGLLSDDYSSALRHVLGPSVYLFIAPFTIIVLWKPALRSGNEVRNAFFFSGLLLALSIIVHYLIQSGHVGNNRFLENASSLFSLLFSLVIYYSISKRYQAMRREKNAAQRDILEMVRHSERELEQQVLEKTYDLQQAKEVVETALSQERSAHHEQKNFIAMISHELRTPLAVIDATIQNMTRELQNGTPKMYMRLEKIQQSTDRLSSLVTDYLSNDRFDVLSRGVHCAEINPLPMLEDAVNAAAPLANGHVFIIDKVLPKKIWADVDLLRLVLRTLVDNAVKYTRPATLVTLRLEEFEEGWFIDVIDEGEGIAPAERELVFERYYRGRNAVKRTGTGLGLPLALQLVELQGGTLQLLYTTVRGCTFRIFIPSPIEDVQVG